MERLLMQAAAKDDRPLLEKIVKGEYGSVSQDGLDQAMIRAASVGHTECVAILMDHGADPLAVDMDGDTALMMSASNGYPNTLKLLIKGGSDVNQTSERGRTALHMAVWTRQTAALDILLRENCDPNVNDCYGDTPLLLCSRKGYADILEKLLMNGCTMTSVNSDKDNALHYAARYGHADLVSVMLTVAASYNILDDQNVWGKTPLLFAVEFKHELCAELLIAAGCHIFLTDTSQRTALHYCAKNGLYRCARILVDMGAVIDEHDAESGSPLIYAAANNHMNIVQLLVQNGCNVDIMGLCKVLEQYSWFLPVQVAIGNRHFDIAKVLIAAGCTLGEDEVTFRLLKCVFPFSNGEESGEYNWFRNILTQPRQLSHICRIVIKNRIGRGLGEKVKSLPVPKTMQSFLAFCDM